MKLLTIITICLLASLVGGCSGTRSDLDFDVNSLYGLSEKELSQELGKPTETSATRTGTVYFWEKEKTSLGAVFSPNGEFRTFSISVYDSSSKNIYSYEKLRDSFNVHPKDTRYSVGYSAPDNDGSITTVHIRPR